MARSGAGHGFVVLPDGRRVRGISLRRSRQEAGPPDFTLYLLGREPRVPDRASRWVRWHDFRLPDSMEDAIDALREVHARAGSERVEVACGTGIGRTGTALALLAVISGVPPGDAVTWVRTHYHPRAVETRRQREWVRAAAAQLAD